MFINPELDRRNGKFPVGLLRFPSAHARSTTFATGRVELFKNPPASKPEFSLI